VKEKKKLNQRELNETVIIKTIIIMSFIAAWLVSITVEPMIEILK
tara:strand:- start:930 stop:1064 length:135 start_codon:yes stop_codon:yes gene_type:complete